MSNLKSCLGHLCSTGWLCDKFESKECIGDCGIGHPASFTTETNCSKCLVLCPDPLRNVLSPLCTLISLGSEPNSWHLLFYSDNYLWLLEPLCLDGLSVHIPIPPPTGTGVGTLSYFASKWQKLVWFMLRVPLRLDWRLPCLASSFPLSPLTDFS